MKNRVLQYFFIMMVFAFSCSTTITTIKYEVEGSRVYINKYVNGKFSVKEELMGADAVSFRILGNGGYIAADKNRVYVMGDKKENGKKYGDIFKEIFNADPETLQGIKPINGENYIGYYKDKDNVYYSHVKIEGADPVTFQSISSDYGKDKDNVYFEGGKINGADPGTFAEIVSKNDGFTGYYMDKNNIYSKGKILDKLDRDEYQYKKTDR